MVHTSTALMYADQVTLGDAMAYYAHTMRMARQTLQERMSVVVERALARRVVANKQQDAQQLQYGRHPHPDRVEAAKEEVQEAQQQLSALDDYLAKVHDSLQDSLQRHSIHTHQDLLASIQRHACTSRAIEQRLADELASLAEACRASAADAQQAAYEAAHAPRRITPAQAAAARMTGRSVPEQPDAADQLSKLRERGPEAAPPSDERGPEAEPAGDELNPESAGDEPSPEAPSFPSLAFQRDRERGPWTRLSASAAAQALGGPW